jgi:hypothetical protein
MVNDAVSKHPHVTYIFQLRRTQLITSS